jgi:hypothetical protein
MSDSVKQLRVLYNELLVNNDFVQDCEDRYHRSQVGVTVSSAVSVEELVVMMSDKMTISKVDYVRGGFKTTLTKQGDGSVYCSIPEATTQEIERYVYQITVDDMDDGPEHKLQRIFGTYVYGTYSFDCRVEGVKSFGVSMVDANCNIVMKAEGQSYKRACTICIKRLEMGLNLMQPLENVARLRFMQVGTESELHLSLRVDKGLSANTAFEWGEMSGGISRGKLIDSKAGIHGVAWFRTNPRFVNAERVRALCDAIQEPVIYTLLALDYGLARITVTAQGHDAAMYGLFKVVEGLSRPYYG